jgi:hypothetical protein
MLTFNEAESMHANARGDMRLRNNTWLIRLDSDTYAVRYHRTNVVVIHQDGRYTLNTGGWMTATTKDRINHYGPLRVYQKARVWYLPDGTRFIDGMVYSMAEKRVVS